MCILWGKDKPGLTDAKVKEGLFFCCPCVNLQQVAWGKSWSAATMLHYGPTILYFVHKTLSICRQWVSLLFWDHKYSNSIGLEKFSLEAILDGFNLGFGYDKFWILDICFVLFSAVHTENNQKWICNTLVNICHDKMHGMPET